ncbi:hypothetical protein RJJ65_32195 [Rhizobium hidalgonense]|uniref:Uncharacterized protein n=1 Tax=Rhizobium hidalgonense TaxID=1538159 RepID=A0AAJ2H0D5_9HYPH|nr:hypothetical protein [Rhizobium hidalgonense]MDR9777220.1 hypothetical protein [Rhizobium hidalgonense]
MNDLFGNAIPPNQSAMFEEFWGLYPRRVGKGKAEASFSKALNQSPFSQIMHGLRQQIAYLESKPMDLRPHPTTWLNQKRWLDDPQPIQRNGRRTIADAARDFLTSNDYRGDAFGLPSIIDNGPGYADPGLSHGIRRH